MKLTAKLAVASAFALLAACNSNTEANNTADMNAMDLNAGMTDLNATADMNAGMTDLNATDLNATGNEVDINLTNDATTNNSM